MRILFAALLVLASAAAHAQFNGCATGFCAAGTGGGGGGSGSFLLSNTGSALLVNTGVKFLVQ